MTDQTPRYQNILIKFDGETLINTVTVGIGYEPLEDDIDPRIFYYFKDEAEFASSFHKGWDGDQTDFHTIGIIE